MEKIETSSITSSKRIETGEVRVNGQFVDRYYWRKQGSEVLHFCTFAEVMAVIKKDMLDNDNH